MTDNEIENSTGAPAYREQVETAVQALRQEVERRLDQSRADIQELMDGFVENLPAPPPPPEAPAPAAAAAEPEAEAAGLQQGVAPVGGPAMADLRDAIAELDEADNQAELMARLVEQASTFASRTVLLLDNQDQGLKSWASLGFGRAGTSLEGLEFPPMVEPAWLAARESSQSLSGAQCSPLWKFIDVEQPMQGALVPLSVRGKVLAFLYADQTSPGNRFSIEALQLLAHSAAQKLDLLPLGAQAPSATLKLQMPEDGGLGLGGALAAGAGTAALAATAESAQSGFQQSAASEEASLEESVQQIPPASEAPTFEEAAASEELFQPAFEPPPAPGAPRAFDSQQEMAATEEDDLAGIETSAVFETPSASLDVETFDPVAEASGSALADGRLTQAERDAGFVLEEIPPIEEAAEPATPETFAPEEEPSPLADVVEDEPTTGPDHPTAPPAGFAPPVPEVPPAPAPPPVPDSTYEDSTYEPAGFATDPTPPTSPAFEPVPEPAGVEASLATQVITPEQIAAMGPAGPAPQSSTVAEPPPAIEEAPPVAPSFEQAPSPGASGASPSASQTSSSQVMPPADLEGPGLAFQETQAAGDDPAHEEAKRLARLLVSEIKLYNGEQIRAGKVAGNIYGQMRDDIDRSRQMYEERIDARVKQSSDYFRDELVRTLADGDDSILGM